MHIGSKKILGIDFGERRIGLALSDITCTTAQGLTTIDTRKFPDFIGRILHLAKENKVDQLVVGYPLRTDGIHSEKAEVVDQFIANLEVRIQEIQSNPEGYIPWKGLRVKLPIERENEAYSSARAESHLQSTHTKKQGKRKWDPRKNKAKIDEGAAVCILQDYLNGRGAPR
jgi:putative Holliday junction resolvase